MCTTAVDIQKEWLLSERVSSLHRTRSIELCRTDLLCGYEVLPLTLSLIGNEKPQTTFASLEKRPSLLKN